MIEFNFLEGEVLLFDKPLGWTSFDVVNKVRGMIKYHAKIKKIKVGHAGTLDPLATGLLVICTGKKTKTINEIQAEHKEYTGVITLGGTTPSYDLETEVDTQFPTDHITEETIYACAKTFVGQSEQKVPSYSAKWVNGQRAYKKARRGEAVDTGTKSIEILSFEVEKIEMPNVYFRISCSKGTYIRSIADDFGQNLNSGSHLSKLCRTAINKLKLADAISVEAFDTLLDEKFKEQKV